jgi:O-antigen ligase
MMNNMARLLLEWALLFSALVAFTVTETYQSYVTLGLLLLLLSFTVRAVRTHRLLPRTGLEIPWLLGLVSAAVAVWIAYNRPIALLQFYRLLAAAVLYYAVVALPVNYRRWLALGFLAAAAGLALYWPWHNDFAAQPGKLALITQLGLFANSLLSPLPGPDIHGNVAAGTLLVALPFGAALAADSLAGGAGRRRTYLAALAILLTLVILFGLFLTSSRGAWLAVGGTLALAGLAWLQRRFFPGPQKQLALWGAAVLLAGLALAAILLSGSFDRLAGSIPDPSGGILSRPRLWQQGWQVARDYLFTGSGLMTFWLVHPIYVLLIHVPYIAHAHNTFLEVWVEQGVLGFVGLLAAGIVVLIWTWKALGRRSVSMWGWAGLAALTAASLHGLVDVVFYVTRTLPVVGLLFGYAWFLNFDRSQERVQSHRTENHLSWLLPAMLLFLLGLALLLRRPVASTIYANLGAVQQTRLELTRYDPEKFNTYTLDQVRLDSQQDGSLDAALESFERALDFDPLNLSTLQRRAQIELSLGDETAALQDIQALWQAGLRDEVTRLTYGDALVANGQPQAAAEVVQGLTWAEPRLLGQAWSRYWINQDYRRAADAWQTVLLLNPQAQGIKDFLQQAREKSK